MILQINKILFSMMLLNEYVDLLDRLSWKDTTVADRSLKLSVVYRSGLGIENSRHTVQLNVRHHILDIGMVTRKFTNFWYHILVIWRFPEFLLPYPDIVTWAESE